MAKLKLQLSFVQYNNPGLQLNSFLPCSGCSVLNTSQLSQFSKTATDIQNPLTHISTQAIWHWTSYSTSCTIVIRADSPGKREARGTQTAVCLLTDSKYPKNTSYHCSARLLLYYFKIQRYGSPKFYKWQNRTSLIRDEIMYAISK